MSDTISGLAFISVLLFITTIFIGMLMSVSEEMRDKVVRIDFVVMIISGILIVVCTVINILILLFGGAA